MTRKLHIGGQTACEGWEILNVLPAPYVDHLCDARDLSKFENDTFSVIYASHVVEHFDYKKELTNTLREWWRVLRPGGKIYVSVPDMDILVQIFALKDQLSLDERFLIMRMMFGGHMDEFDYHLVGLNREFLEMYLREAGFNNFKRVRKFGFFDDTNALLFKDVPISLNMIAEKPA